MEVIEATPNYVLSFDRSKAVLKLQFIGDMSDEVYKEFWTKAINFGRDNQVNRIIIDQSTIGNVSFLARGWVVMNAFPRVKKEFPASLAGAILSSGKVVQKTGMQYLLKAFKGLTGYKVEVVPTEEEAIAWLCKANTLDHLKVA